MPKLVNLIGQTFKSWEVIEKLPSKNKKTYWLCKCEKCGQIKEIQGTHLKNLTCADCACETKNINGSDNQKTCLICGKQFTTIKYGQNRKFCFECSPSYSKNDNKGRGQTITSIRRAIKQVLVDYKGNKCSICGYSKNLAALQFHHLDPDQKDFDISTEVTLNDFSIDNYYKEIDKCILVCANCHAELHNPNLFIE